MKEILPVIQDLLDTLCAGDAAAGPCLRQTHISYLIFTPEFVYKIKKPVDFGFLDFSTLEKRLHFCKEEVRLNRRLAPGVYLGVTGIVMRHGRAALGVEAGSEARGERVVEYAVTMRRLDEGRMLERRIRDRRVTAAEVGRVARAIARFHASAATDERISAFGSPAAVSRNADENFVQTRPFVAEGGLIAPRLFETIRDYTRGFIGTHTRTLEARATGGFVRDCHGDIHAEHVAVGEDIEIIDCIEFNERLRFSDTVADAAFLSMDLDYLGRHDLARVFDAAYLAASGDAQGGDLLDFYRCYRAYVRGKVACLKYDEAEVPEAARAAACISARRHFHLAGLYAGGGYRPMLIVVCGLPGTGKSSLAGGLAEAADMEAISSDRVRKETAGLDPGARGGRAFAEGIYSEEFTEKTYCAMIKRASGLLASGRPVVLDATFLRARHMEAAREAALLCGASFHVVECTAGEEVVRERMRERERTPGVLSDARWEVYLRLKQTRDPLRDRRITIDTGTEASGQGPVGTVVEKIFC